MNTLPTGLDTIASIVALIVAVLSGLTLFGMGILMAVGAVFSRRPLVTSWTAEQEHSFTPFEQRSSTANSQAWVLGLLGAALVGVFAIGIYVSVTPDMKDISKTMNMSNLTKKPAVAPPRTEAAPPAATPGAAPAETPSTPPAEAPATPPDPAPAPEAPRQ
jgi:hypothetical protein